MPVVHLAVGHPLPAGRLAALVAVVFVLPPGAPLAAQVPAAAVCVIDHVVDGDTIGCQGGERVRLLLIDAPELAQGPLGRAAHAYLEALLPVGSSARLERDVEARDRYGRLLAYVYLPDGRMVNRELVRQGFAVPLVYPPNVRYVESIRAAADEAEADQRGLWSIPAFQCTPVDFRNGLCDGAAPPAEPGAKSAAEAPADSSCHPGYADVCIPPPPPDLDCRDIPARRIRVVGSDPHRLDGNHDGVACEG